MIHQMQATQPHQEESCTALMFAAYKGSKKAVKLLIKAGANVNAKENDGYAVLSVAAMEHAAY